ncbi:DUF6011 domain-containing protein [Kitasatospora sp. NBC_01266]|uniref:DUF6011 domain-containing protein n=1 Tax=Kitasatospora sp. NBC_01266 TaxID=2903572 RepID=UPI002E37F27D|nr:DUF6011 domain-containing protein [Kitasatospora sp. NBC_01266]
MRAELVESQGPEPLLPGLAAEERLVARVTCRGCGRLLHDPESRMLRLGPGCRHTGEPVRRHVVEQDALPGL